MTEDWKKVQNADVWIHEEGESIEGVYLGVEKDVGLNKSNLYMLEVSEGVKKSVWGSKILDDCMLGLKIGTHLKIDFKGKIQPENGNEYKSYEVFTK